MAMINAKWPEIDEIQKKGKKDLKLVGDKVAKRVEEAKGVLEPQLWTLVLSRLEINGIPSLQEIPAEIANLKTLKELNLADNSISKLTERIGELTELKILVLSNNKLTQFPKALCVGLKNCLQVLSLAQNKIDSLPQEMGSMKELITLNLQQNLLNSFPLQLCNLHRLSSLNLCNNSIGNLHEADFSNMPALLTLDISHNMLVETPVEIGLCAKLTHLTLGDNPFKDKKFVKLLESGKVKNVIQQLKKSAPVKKQEEEEDDDEPLRIRIENFPEDDPLQCIVGPSQTQRQFIVLTVVKGLEFSENTYRIFIDAQTEIHQTLCKKRTLATIGTHDMTKFRWPIYYNTRTPEKLCFVPLKLDKPLTGLELAKHFEDIKDDSMLKYLSMIRGNQVWPILHDATGEIMCLPPVINSKYSQISVDSKDILIEVTSATNLQICKDTMAAYLKKIVGILPFTQQLVVVPVRVQGENGHVRVQYPTQKDVEEICAQL